VSRVAGLALALPALLAAPQEDRRATRLAFLEQNPLSLDALVDTLGETDPAAVANAWWLPRLIRHPEWCASPELPGLLARLAAATVREDPRPAWFQEVVEHLDADLRRDAYDPRLWALAGALAPYLDPGRAHGWIVTAKPLPGLPWPPPSAAGLMDGLLRQRPGEATLSAIVQSLVRASFQGNLPPGADGPLCRTSALTDWAPIHLRDLVRRERWDEATAWATELRTLAGPAWPAATASLGRVLGDAPPGPRLQALRAVLAQRAAAGNPPPRGEELPTLALLGRPPWLEGWNRLPAHPLLEPWSMGLVRWTAPAGAEAARLRAEFGLAFAEGWALVKGGRLVGSGAEAPDPEALAALLRQYSPTPLQVLGSLLREDPTLVSARKCRLDLVQRRMPNARLEPAYLEDARELLASPPRASWRPTRPLWENAAPKVLRGLEQRLALTPHVPELWTAWTEWSDLSPERPSPLDLLSRLPVWRREPGLLAPRAEEAVLRALTTQQRWEEVARWGQASWRGGGQDRLRSLVRQGDPAVARPLVEALVAPCLDALQRLGQAEPRSRILAELGAIHPALVAGRR
jgi:hypothetical protein